MGAIRRMFCRMVLGQWVLDSHTCHQGRISLLDTSTIEIATDKPLFPWQQLFIQEVVYGDSKYSVLEKSRRIGGTWTCAIAAVMYCLEHNQNCWFSSSDEQNAREFIAYVKEACEVMNAILGEEAIDINRANTETVYLPNGKKISGLSSSPRALRGKDGLIFWDEAALHEQQEAFYRAAQGCVIQRGKLVILSTHNGPATLFNRLAREAQSGKVDWKWFRVTLEDAVKEGYAWRFTRRKNDTRLPEQVAKDFIASVRAGCLNDDHYGQEFQCKPLGVGSLISEEIYKALSLWDAPDSLLPDEILPDGTIKRRYKDLFAGIDVGRTHDLTVIWVVERHENHKALNQYDQYDYKTVCVRSIRNSPFPVQYAELSPIVAHPQMRGVLIDRGAVGRSIADAFCDAFSDRCDPFDFIPSRQGVLAERVKGYMEYKRLSVPNNIPQAMQDFLCVRRESSPSGTIRYVGETATTHADHFWAAGMALEAAEMNTGAIIV